MTDNMTAIRQMIGIENVGMQFRIAKGSVTALSGINLSISEGEFCVVVGPSGCGKTTLLNIIAGLEIQTEGTVSVARKDTTQPISAVVFQDHSVLPWLTVRKNVGYGLRNRRVSRAEERAIVDHYLKLTGLSSFADAYSRQLSGGMKQRVSLARAFANDPQVLLMDEPFANLDEQSRVYMQQELLRIWSADRKTVFFITHSIDEAVALGDRVIVLSPRPGRIVREVVVDLERPRDVIAIKNSAAFRKAASEVWDVLRAEASKPSGAKQGGACDA